MALTVTFVKDTTTLTLPAPAPGADAEAIRLQSEGVAAGGLRYVYDAGVTRFRKVETFENLSTTEKDGLADFFAVVLGMARTFTYTDSAGTAFTARFAEPKIGFRKVAADVWDTTVPLWLDDMAG